uniref:Uncharacterized protein n=1 Tax=Cacopsylla melanoneura TaxID=428564 RepID=A0A8D8Y0W3_9HEMI
MDGNKITNGSYYVVQQFRNYLINPLTSNTEALGANLLDDTISDTNPAPPSYTLVPDNAVTVQVSVRPTSARFLALINLHGEDRIHSLQLLIPPWTYPWSF